MLNVPMNLVGEVYSCQSSEAQPRTSVVLLVLGGAHILRIKEDLMSYY
jgi:hypothetical protein